MKKTLLTLALCLPLLVGGCAHAEPAPAKNHVWALMLRVDVPQTLSEDGLRAQVARLLAEEKFMGIEDFGVLFIREREPGTVTFTAFVEAQREALRNMLDSKLEDADVSYLGDQFKVTWNDTYIVRRQMRSVMRTIGTLNKRLRAFGVAEPKVSRVGSEHILVEVPATAHLEDFRTVVTRPATFAILPLNPNLTPQEALMRGAPPGSGVYWGERAGQKIPYLLRNEPVVTGLDIAQAQPATDASGAPVVVVTLKSAAGERFAEASAKAVGKRLAAVFENRVLIAPTVTAPIKDGRLVIGNLATTAQAEQLAILLKAGAYPAPVRIVEEREEPVSPSLP